MWLLTHRVRLCAQCGLQYRVECNKFYRIYFNSTRKVLKTINKDAVNLYLWFKMYISAFEICGHIVVLSVASIFFFCCWCFKKVLRNIFYRKFCSNLKILLQIADSLGSYPCTSFFLFPCNYYIVFWFYNCHCILRDCID